MSRLPIPLVTASCSLLLFAFGSISSAYADSMSALIAQKSVQSNYSSPSYSAVPSAKVSTRSTIQRAGTYRSNATNTQPAINANTRYSTAHAINTPSYGTRQSAYRYPSAQNQAPVVLPAFLSGNYDNVDNEYFHVEH